MPVILFTIPIIENVCCRRFCVQLFYQQILSLPISKSASTLLYFDLFDILFLKQHVRHTRSMYYCHPYYSMLLSSTIPVTTP